MVAIVGAQDFVVANAERGLAAVRAVRTGLGNVGHFPRARLVAVGSAGKRADRTDVDAHAAFFAGERAFFIRQDYGMHATGADAESFHVHALIAHAHAAEAENAARRVIKNERRPLLFRVMQFFFCETAVIEAVAEGHVLQFAFAALVADRAIERMIGEEKLDHVFARFVNLGGVGLNHHALDGDECAGGLKLGRFFYFHETHTTCGLESEPGVIAERGNFDALVLGRFDHEGPGRSGHLLIVDRERDLFLFGHLASEPRQSRQRACTGNRRAGVLRIHCAIFSRC